MTEKQLEARFYRTLKALYDRHKLPWVPGMEATFLDHLAKTPGLPRGRKDMLLVVLHRLENATAREKKTFLQILRRGFEERGLMQPGGD